jgi:quercetin dioxygenase-like cupin family protein
VWRGRLAAVEEGAVEGVARAGGEDAAPVVGVDLGLPRSAKARADPCADPADCEHGEASGMAARCNWGVPLRWRLVNESVETVTWSESGEGEQLWFLGTLATIRVPGEATGGRFALIEFLFPRSASPPLHTHPQDESYIVLEGTLTVLAGARRFQLAPGATAVVPMGVAHTFRVDTDAARVLVLSTPAGLERMVRDGSVPATSGTLPPADARRPSAEELLVLFRAHGQINCGSPLAPGD